MSHPFLVPSIPSRSIKITPPLCGTHLLFDLTRNDLSWLFLTVHSTQPNVAWSKGASTEELPRAHLPLSAPIDY